MSDRAAHVTPSGAEWLASSSIFPRSVHALWSLRPGAPSVLPCGAVFDVISSPSMFGRRLLDRLWSTGPGTGPVATYGGRMMIFASPGTAQRLPALLGWREWEGRGGAGARGETIPPLLGHGLGDAVTVPPLQPAAGSRSTRWLVAPEVRHPWLPGPETLLWACVHTVRAGRTAGPSARDQSISAPCDQDAKVYDVSRRR